MEENLFVCLLESLRIPYTQPFANRLFEETPHKYSLFGLSRMLGTYGIPSEGLRLSDKKQLADIPPPFIAQVSNDLGVVTQISEQSVTYIVQGKLTRSAYDRFLEISSGVVLVPYPDADSGEPDLALHRREQCVQRVKVAGVWVCALLLFLPAVHSGNSVFRFVPFVLLLLEGAGLWVSVLLLLHQLAVRNRSSERLCNLFHYDSCNSVLDSPASRWLGGISWSETGFAFFGVNLLLLLVHPSSIPVLGAMHACALPYCVWSLWYQRFRAHSWCPLCLLVLSLLVLQFLCCLFGGVFPGSLFDMSFLVDWVFVGLAYAGSALALNLLLPLYGRLRQAADWKYAFRTLKFRKDVFETLLHHQLRYDAGSETSTLVFGNPDAYYQITVFSNPYCNPCARMHQRLHALPESDFCFRYVFTSFGPAYEEAGRLLIAVYRKYGPERALPIYDEWYAGGKSRQSRFFDAYGLNADAEDVLKEYKRHTEWQERTRLSSTPTLLVNGYLLPSDYQLEDLAELN